MVHISLLQGFLPPRWCRTSSINRTTILQATKPIQQTKKSTSTRHRPRCNDANEQNGTKQDGLARALGSRPHFLFIHGWSQLQGVLYFCAGYHKLPANVFSILTLPQQKKRVCNWGIVLAGSSFFLEEALSLSFFSCKKPFQIMMSQSISIHIKQLTVRLEFSGVNFQPNWKPLACHLSKPFTIHHPEARKSSVMSKKNKQIPTGHVFFFSILDKSSSHSLLPLILTLKLELKPLTKMYSSGTEIILSESRSSWPTTGLLHVIR